MQSIRCLLRHSWKRRRRRVASADASLPPDASVAQIDIAGRRGPPLMWLVWTQCERCGVRAVSAVLAVALMWAAAPIRAAEPMRAALHVQVLGSTPESTVSFLRVPLRQRNGRDVLSTSLFGQRSSASPPRRGAPGVDRSGSRSCNVSNEAVPASRSFVSVCLLRW